MKIWLIYLKACFQFHALPGAVRLVGGEQDLSDVAGVPRELMTDADRVMPGEGDFRLESVVGRLRQIGYAGYVSMELMNPVLWQSPPAHVAELGMASLRRLLGGS